MGQAGTFADIARPIQVFESGIAIGVHPAGIFGQVIFGVFPFAVAGEAIPGRWRDFAAPGAFIATIGPQPRRLGLSSSRCEHGNWGIICKDCLTRQHIDRKSVV